MKGLGEILATTSCGLSFEHDGSGFSEGYLGISGAAFGLRWIEATRVRSMNLPTRPFLT